MDKKKERLEDEKNELEQWLESFFLDPLTSILDQTLFRIDIFETSSEIIIEAFLPDVLESNVSVETEGSMVEIKVEGKSTKDSKVRKVCLPFPIYNKEAKAIFANGILEIFISKTKSCKGQNKVIPISDGF